MLRHLGVPTPSRATSSYSVTSSTISWHVGTLGKSDSRPCGTRRGPAYELSWTGHRSGRLRYPTAPAAPQTAGRTRVASSPKRPRMCTPRCGARRVLKESGSDIAGLPVMLATTWAYPTVRPSVRPARRATGSSAVDVISTRLTGGVDMVGVRNES